MDICYSGTGMEAGQLIRSPSSAIIGHSTVSYFATLSFSCKMGVFTESDTVGS